MCRLWQCNVKLHENLRNYFRGEPHSNFYKVQHYVRMKFSFIWRSNWNAHADGFRWNSDKLIQLRKPDVRRKWKTRSSTIYLTALIIRTSYTKGKAYFYTWVSRYSFWKRPWKKALPAHLKWLRWNDLEFEDIFAVEFSKVYKRVHCEILSFILIG